MPEVNGIDTSSASSFVSSTNKKEGALDKEAFLQLLVTQMKYQDPLNPSDSTQYMSQLAQYSTLEATMNISSTVDKGNAYNLAGEYVIVNSTDAAGNKTHVSGLVEYVTIADGEPLLSIKGTYYPAKDLDSVVDYDYYKYLQGLEEDKDNVDPDNNEDDKGDKS